MLFFPSLTGYSFWVGASLDLLGHAQMTDGVALTCFAKCCEGAKGGLSKVPNTHPDLLHSYYALAGLALARSLGEQLRALDARLGITSRACDAAGLRTPETAPAAGSCLPCDDGVDPMRNGDSR